MDSHAKLFLISWSSRSRAVFSSSSRRNACSSTSILRSKLLRISSRPSIGAISSFIYSIPTGYLVEQVQTSADVLQHPSFNRDGKGGVPHQRTSSTTAARALKHHERSAIFNLI